MFRIRSRHHQRQEMRRNMIYTTIAESATRPSLHLHSGNRHKISRTHCTVATPVLSFGSIGQEVRSLYMKNKALIGR